ncbi:MAG TPA: VWA domain-containing protein [Rhodothermales bacterium]|nr:VWA domain-containing protein [Rhodothermales bacterium]
MPPPEPPTFVFAAPAWLWALGLLPVAAWGAWWASRRPATMRTGRIVAAEAPPPTLRQRLLWLPMALRLLALGLTIVALARPQERGTIRTRTSEGLDIILALDTSTSMEALDFSPNRFEAAREVALRFLQTRTSDRVGLVVFAAKAFTQAPLTLDLDFVARMLVRSETGMIEDGTAIGTALATAVSRLRDSKAKSRVVILLTDGQNNRGEIDPQSAAEIARAVGVRVYTVGVGKDGKALYVFQTPYGPQQQFVDVNIDEKMLSEIAERTGGRYFRATNATTLEGIYDEIGRLETSALTEQTYAEVTERYAWFLWPALLLLLFERLLATTWLRRLP